MFKGFKLFSTSRTSEYSINDIEALFDDLELSSIKKNELTEECESLDRQRNMLSRYTKLSSSSVAELEKLVEEYKNIKKTMRSLKGRIVKNNNGYVIDKANEVTDEEIENLRNLDKEVKELERDIYYLNEEKEALEIQRKRIINAYSFIGVVILAATLLSFMVAFVISSNVYMELESKVNYIIGIITLYCIVLASVIVSKNKLEHKLDTNEKLQHKAVSYSNKSKMKYYHSYRYLNYMLDFYGVDNIASLDIEYAKKVKNRNNEDAYVSLNRKLLDIENDIGKLFHGTDIDVRNIESLEELLQKCQKATHIDDIGDNIKKIKEQITALKKYEEQLIKQIQALKFNSGYSDLVNERLGEYDSKMRKYRSMKKSTKA